MSELIAKVDAGGIHEDAEDSLSGTCVLDDLEWGGEEGVRIKRRTKRRSRGGE